MIKLPTFSQWKQIFKVLTKSEKIVLTVSLVLAGGSFFFLAMNFYLVHTKPVPAFGGTYTEGLVGQPRFINPIYGETNDVDRTLIDLVFSGLMSYDKDGNIVPDLIKEYAVSADGKTYTFTLKDDISWHDGRPLTSSDVLFTIKTIQNSDYKSPLRANWIDVGLQKISDTSFSFILKQPYNSFIENCTVKIIPAHIWQDILPENFILSSYNLRPIGSGPFAFENLSQVKNGFIENLVLQSNRRYFTTPSFISRISFKFFKTSDELEKSANAGQVNGFTLDTQDKNGVDKEKTAAQKWDAKKFSAYQFSLPRYFAVFFNLASGGQKSPLLSNADIRKALTLATDKQSLISIISSESITHIKTVESPILPDFYGYQQPTSTYGFDVNKANALLEKAGFKLNEQGVREKTIKKQAAFQFKSYLKTGSKGTEVVQLQGCLARLDDNFKKLLIDETNGTYGKSTEDAVTEFQKKYLPDRNPTGETGTATRKKLNELCVAPSQDTQSLTFLLVTINQPQLLEVANLLKNYWQAVGVSININAVSISDLKPIIKNRDYDMLLYGETLGMEPDMYPFWYSSQKIDPGLNLSSYENKDVDKLLKSARQTSDKNQKAKDLEKIQNIIINDAPALFLYNPDYLYRVSEKVKGIDTVRIADPAKRFANITSWYLKTKRVWK